MGAGINTRTALMAVLVWAGSVLAACGGGQTAGTADTAGAPVTTDPAGEADGDPAAGGGAGSGGAAAAALTVGSEVYAWTADDTNVCTIDGAFGPANADFGVPPSQGGEGPWVQFIDRGDGSVNFSAVLAGEQYMGTGPGRSEPVGTDGFTYTGTMSRSGQTVEVVLEVSC